MNSNMVQCNSPPPHLKFLKIILFFQRVELSLRVGALARPPVPVETHGVEPHPGWRRNETGGFEPMMSALSPPSEEKNKFPIKSASPLNIGVGGLGSPLGEIPATERKTALAHIQAEWGGRGGGGDGEGRIDASGGGGDEGDNGGGGGGEIITRASASFFSSQRKSPLVPIAPRAAA